MHPVMRLYEDSISGGAAAVSLPALARMIFVVHGAVAIDGTALSDGEAWSGEGACSLAAGKDGVTVWRFELAASGSSSHPIKGVLRSQEKLAAPLATVPQGELLLSGDSVAFPPGGCAFLHKHWGPGIRCLLDGGIRIDTHGRSTSYGPGSAWYETGSDPVFAQAAMIGRAASSASWCCRARCSAKARSSSSTRRTRPSRACSNTRFSPTCRSRRRPERAGLVCRRGA